jgi:hypothetical protein
MVGLFQQVLGEAFQTLPAPIRALHTAVLPRQFHGHARVVAAEGRIARCLGRLLGFPGCSVDAPIAVTIESAPGGQRWTRHFPPRPMVSSMWSEHGLLLERFGPVTLRFRLHGDSNGLQWHLVAVRVLGMPLPLAWFRGVSAREYVRDGRYRFQVRGAIVGIGILVSYEGWIDVG